MLSYRTRPRASYQLPEPAWFRSRASLSTASGAVYEGCSSASSRSSCRAIGVAITWAGSAMKIITSSSAVVSRLLNQFLVDVNQFLVDAEEPLLRHTGLRPLFPLVKDAAE